MVKLIKKKCQNVRNELFIQVLGSCVYFFKSYSCTTEKSNRRDAKEVNKKKNKVMTQLLEASVFLPISSESLVPLFNSIFFPKNIHILPF